MTGGGNWDLVQAVNDCGADMNLQDLVELRECKWIPWNWVAEMTIAQFHDQVRVTSVHGQPEYRLLLTCCEEV